MIKKFSFANMLREQLSTQLKEKSKEEDVSPIIQQLKNKETLEEIVRKNLKMFSELRNMVNKYVL